MSKVIEINNVGQLKQYILNNELSRPAIKNLLHTTLGVFMSDRKPDYDKVVLCELIGKFVKKYPDRERPFFLDVPDEKIVVQDFGYIPPVDE